MNKLLVSIARIFKNKINLRRRKFTWLIPLALAIVTFVTVDIYIWWDLGLYNALAINVSKGKGYVDVFGNHIYFRPPGFPLMLAGSFKLLGTTLRNSFWVIRIFAILNPLILYFLGKKMFNRWVGLTVSLLFLTSYQVNYVSYRNLDHVWPFFVLVFVYLLYSGLESERYLHFVLAGISLGLAYWVKEVALIFAPLPFTFSFIKRRYRDKKIWLKGTLVIILFLVTISPWIFYLLKENASLLNLLGRGGPRVLSRSASGTSNSGFQPLLFVLNYLKGFGKGYMRLRENFVLAPLFVISLMYISLRSFLGREAERLMLVAIFLTTPVLTYAIGIRNMRLGQAIISFVFLYLAMGVTFVDGIEEMIDKFKSKLNFEFGVYVPRILQIFIVGLCITAQLVGFGGTTSNLSFLDRSRIIRGFTSDELFALNAKLTVDGKIPDSASEVFSASIGNEKPLIFGARAGSKIGNFFTGQLDQVVFKKENIVLGKWTFNESRPSSLAVDFSGHGQEGTIYGALYHSDDSNEFLLFDGKDDYVKVEDNSRLDLRYQEKQDYYSIEGRLKTSSRGSWSGIIDKRGLGTSGSNRGYSIDLQRGAIAAILDDGEGHYIVLKSNRAGRNVKVNDERWHEFSVSAVKAEIPAVVGARGYEPFCLARRIAEVIKLNVPESSKVFVNENYFLRGRLRAMYFVTEGNYRFRDFSILRDLKNYKKLGCGSKDRCFLVSVTDHSNISGFFGKRKNIETKEVYETRQFVLYSIEIK